MKRYHDDPNAPVHLRKLLDSAAGDDLDARRRRRVAARLGLVAALAPVPGPAPGTGGGGGGGASAGASGAARPRLSLATLAVSAVVLIGATSAVVVSSRMHSPIADAPPSGAAAMAVATAEKRPVAAGLALPLPALGAAPVAALPSPEAVPSVDIAALPDVKARALAAPTAATAHAATPSLAVAISPSPTLEGAAEPSDLHAEIVALEAARAATAAGTPSEALARLDDYSVKFRSGKLREEAAVLRIEALAANGDHLAARAAADRLLRESPNTVYAARVRAALARASREQSP